jgi:transcriptional regulator with XRE-family HTH domain
MTNAKTTVSAIILARNVRRLRNQKNWTQYELAKKMNRPQQRVNEIEQGRHASVDTRTIDLLAKALGVTQSMLLDNSFSDK